jgi:hypothetical protein
MLMKPVKAWCRTEPDKKGFPSAYLLRWDFHNKQSINVLAIFAAKVIFLVIRSKPRNFASEEKENRNR